MSTLGATCLRVYQCDADETDTRHAFCPASFHNNIKSLLLHDPTIIMQSVKRSCCLLALILAGSGSGSVRSAAPDDEHAVRSYRPLCSSAPDSTATRLFKGLLKSVLLYATTRRHDAVSVEKSDEFATQSKGIEEYLVEQFQNVLGLFSFGFSFPAEITSPWSWFKSSFFDGRKVKNKNLGPILAAVVATTVGTMLPLAFGVLFLVVGKAVVTSVLAIAVSGMLGLKELAGKHSHGHYVMHAYVAAPGAQFAEQQLQSVRYREGQTTAPVVPNTHSAAAEYYAGEDYDQLSAHYDASQRRVQWSTKTPATTATK